MIERYEPCIFGTDFGSMRPEMSPSPSGGYVKYSDYLAIVDKLPVYADTGERFIPNRNEAWVLNYQDTALAVGHMKLHEGQWSARFTRFGNGVPVPYYESGPFYSTEAAAEQAAQEGGEG